MLVAEYSYEQEKSATVQRMLRMGLFDLEVIAQAVGLTIDEVTGIKSKMKPVC